MNKKHVYLSAAIVISSGYIIKRPKVLFSISKSLNKVSANLNRMSIYLDTAEVCIDIVKEHPELHDDPRLVALEDKLAFF